MRRLVLFVLLLGVVVGVALLDAQTAGRSDTLAAGAPEATRSDSSTANAGPTPDSIGRSDVAAASSTPTGPGPNASGAIGPGDRVGGYEVLAVFTPDTLACMREDEVRLVLRSTEPTLEEHLASPDPASVMANLRQQGVRDPENWSIEIVGPGTSLEQIMQGVQRWNEAMADGCVQWGRVVIATPAAQDAADP